MQSDETRLVFDELEREALLLKGKRESETQEAKERIQYLTNKHLRAKQ